MVAEAFKAVSATGVSLDTTEYELGAAHFLRTGEVLPDPVLEELRGYEAIFLGRWAHRSARLMSRRACSSGGSSSGCGSSWTCT